MIEVPSEPQGGSIPKPRASAAPPWVAGAAGFRTLKGFYNGPPSRAEVGVPQPVALLDPGRRNEFSPQPVAKLAAGVPHDR